MTLSRIEELTGFKTTDGVVHSNIQEARKHQARLDITEMYDRAGLAADVRDWIECVWEELDLLFQVETSGSDPLYLKE